VIGFIVGVLLLIALIGGVFHFSLSGNTSSSTSQTSTTDQTTPVDQSTTASQTTIYTTGDAVTSGMWQVTLNSAKPTTDDGPYHIPKAGNVFLVLNVTLKNTDTINKTASSFLMFTLRDGQGNSYEETALLNSQSPDGAVVADQRIRGDLPYEVPKSVTSFVLQFEPAIGDTADIVQWNINI